MRNSANKFIAGVFAFHFCAWLATNFWVCSWLSSYSDVFNHSLHITYTMHTYTPPSSSTLRIFIRYHNKKTRKLRKHSMLLCTDVNTWMQSVLINELFQFQQRRVYNASTQTVVLSLRANENMKHEHWNIYVVSDEKAHVLCCIFLDWLQVTGNPGQLCSIQTSKSYSPIKRQLLATLKKHHDLDCRGKTCCFFMIWV